MTPTDTRKRDELAEAHSRTHIRVESFKAGYDAALAECAGEIERLKAENTKEANTVDYLTKELKLEYEQRNAALKEVARLKLMGTRTTYRALAEENNALREQCAKLKAALDECRYRAIIRGDQIQLDDCKNALREFAAWEAAQEKT
jgi:Ser-tRNA(Ala) deacylase AlaX